MKKLLVLLCFLCFIDLSVFSQDLIVTSERDSLNCKITKESPEYIYFTFKLKEEIRSTLIKKNDVIKFQYNYYQYSEVPKDKIVGDKAYQYSDGPEVKSVRNNDYQHFRIAINTGFSYQTARISDDVPSFLEDYYNEIKTGYHYGGDFTFFVSETIGIGVKYSQFKTSNSIDNIYIQDLNGNIRMGKMSDDITISFIGPSLSTRLISFDKSKIIVFNFSIGYMDLYNEALVVDPYIMTGNSVGTAYEFCYETLLSKNTTLGFQISLITGLLYEYDLDDGTTIETIDLDTDEYFGIGRIDFSVGIRFNL